MVKTAKILLTGYFARGNIGDDAMADCLQSFLDGRLSDAHIQTCPLPGLSDLRGSRRLFTAARRADWLVLAGGTHFHDSFGWKSYGLLVKFLVLVLTARLFRTRVVYAGVGIGPARSVFGRLAIARLLRLATLTTVRDEKSRTLAGNLGVATASTGFDWAVLSGKPTPVREQRKVLGISVLGYYSTFENNSLRDEEMIRNLADDVLAFAEEASLERVEIFPFCITPAYSDMPSSRLLAALLRERIDVEIVEDREPASVLARIATLSAFLGMRYHSLLFAYLCSVPVAPIVYQDKCAALCDELAIGPELRLTPGDLLAGRGNAILTTLHNHPERFVAGGLMEACARRAHLAGNLIAERIEE